MFHETFYTLIQMIFTVSAPPYWLAASEQTHKISTSRMRVLRAIQPT